MEPYDIHAPVPEVEEIVIGETIVGVECIEIRMEGVYLINCIDPMVDGVAIVLIDE